MKNKAIRIILALILMIAITPLVVIAAENSDGTPAVTITPKVAKARYGGAPTVFTVTAVSPNGGTLTYQWQYDVSGSSGVFENIPGETRRTISIGTQKSEMRWLYRCIVTNTKDGESTRTYAICSHIIDSSYVYEFPFIDVSKNAWYRADIEIIYNYGLLNGRSGTIFAPNEGVTVAEAVKIAVTLHQYYNHGYSSITNGTPNWYTSYIEYARENGILEFDVTDDANELITRQGFVYILYPALPKSQYIEINNIADMAIPDVDASSVFYDAIYAFYRSGILAGTDSSGRFNPENGIMRSEVATILNRLLNLNQRTSIELN